MRWIECQRRVIFYKGGHTKPTLPETELYDHWCYIHQDGRHLMDLVLEYLPLLPIIDMKTKNKWISVQVLYIHFINWVITILMYVIVIG